MQRQQQQQRQGVLVHNCVHGPGAYNLGLVMGQHVDIIEIYWRHRYYPFPAPKMLYTCIYRYYGQYIAEVT